MERAATVCGPFVLTVTFADTILVGPWLETLVEEQVASAGSPVHVTLIAVVKLLEAMKPRVAVPVCPGVVIVTRLGHDTTRNPGWIVNATGALLLLVEKLLSPL